MKKLFKKNFVEILVVAFSLTFGFWLMFSTFGYKDGSILIAAKARSDFGSHIPLIRSFSLGDNFPPEFPIFPGEPIRYHFLFYFLVGILERIGVRIDYALNLPSALSFSFLLITIYFLAKLIFKSRAVAILSIVFFLFNGSFSFLEFFKAHPPSLNSFLDIATNSTFPSFGPYDGKVVSAFWNLNIYTNQRHLALPMAALFALVYYLLKKEQKEQSAPWYAGFFWGALLGILPYSHSSIFIMAYAVLGVFFLFFKRQRKAIILMGILGVIIALPRIYYLKQSTSFVPQLSPGYLIANDLTFPGFAFYWFMNLGISVFLIPLGFMLSNRLGKKVLVAFSTLFVIGNLIQFSPEMGVNHKFFNVFVAIANMFSALVIYKLWKRHNLTKILVIPLITLLTLSGIIDFFAVANDSLGELPDYPKDPGVAWIMQNTPPDSVFLNSTYFFDTASLAGRKIFFGWPYFAWSAGHDTYKRANEIQKMLNPKDLNSLCKKLIENDIDYISIIRDRRSEDFEINFEFFEQNFLKIYEKPADNLVIYETLFSCKNARLSSFFSRGS